MSILVVEPSRTSVLISDTNNIVTSAKGAAVSVISAPNTLRVSTDLEGVNTLTVLKQGTPGPVGSPGVSDQNETYVKITDFVAGTDYMYRGEAVPGTLTTEPFWRVRKIIIDEVSDDISESWANGSDAFVIIWEDRALQSYL